MPDFFRFPVTNTHTQRPGAPAKVVGKPLPAANSLEFLLSAAAPANNCALATTQAVQAAALALAQHEHLVVTDSQAAQSGAAASSDGEPLAEVSRGFSSRLSTAPMLASDPHEGGKLCNGTYAVSGTMDPR